MIRIWDIWVRLFHWSLAATVLLLIFTGQTGVGFFDWHRFLGEIALGLVLFRFLWGIVGSTNARLSALVSRPSHALQHLRELKSRKLKPERGHNAAGGWAVLAMLLVVAIQAGTGLFIADEDELVEGAFYGSAGSSLSDTLYQIHMYNSTVIQTLVALHIVMVFIYLLYAGQNLIVPMIRGDMLWSGDSRPMKVVFRSGLVGLGIALVLVVILGLVLGWI